MVLGNRFEKVNAPQLSLFYIIDEQQGMPGNPNKTVVKIIGKRPSTMVGLKNKTFIVPFDDIDFYRSSLITLIQQPKLRELIALENQKRCETYFSETLMYKKYDSLYTNVLNHNPNRYNRVPREHQ